MDRAARGRSAETRARRHLEARGLRLRAANYRCRWGELDLVMETDTTIVFVEVRYRRRADYGGAAASVDARKRERLARAAGDYLARNGLGERPSRFDVVALGPDERVEWITGAFEAC